LQTPREVRNALVYVLFNHRKHGHGGALVDRCSSARFFDGWSEQPPIPKARSQPEEWPVPAAKTWLMKRGWRPLGRVGLREGPPHDW
jgi:hypothetical protein